MPESAPARSIVAGPGTECPKCGGRLSPPVSGELHCFVECSRCGTRFQLDDPDLLGAGSSRR